MDEVLEKVIEILKSRHDDVDYLTENQLVDGGILDSLDIVTIIAELSDEFDIEIPPQEIIEDNFNSAQGLANMVKRLDA